MTGHVAVDVDELLRLTGGHDACRTGAGDVQRSAGTLSAAHGQDDGLGVDGDEAVFFVGGDDLVLFGDVQDHRVELDGDLRLVHELDEAVGIFGTGEFLAEIGEAETGVDALLQDAAETDVSLQDDDVFFGDPVIFRGRAAAMPAGPPPMTTRS